MTLSSGARSRIQNISRDHVETTVGDLRRYFARSLWLAPNNRYRSDTINKIREDFGPAGNFTPIKQSNLAHYIASSTQMHCIDGWSYLAAAISTLLRGDSFAAVHLAYYAELRAAMSILASDGVGVLNRRHCALTGPKKADKLPARIGGTHAFAWSALEEWSRKTSAGDLIAEAITPFSIPLSDWISNLPGSYTFQPLAQSWIRTWGVDLKRLADQERGDRHARNEASYRPTALSNDRTVSANEAIGLSEQFWELCEPVGSSKFEKLDRRLLRSSLKAIFVGRNASTPNATNDAYKAFVSAVVTSQTISSDQYRRDIERFLLRDDTEGGEGVTQLAKVGIADANHGQLGVIARAFLLLRLASGTVDTTLRKAGVREDELRFWKDGLLQERGLCDPDFPPDQLGDLWKDVDDELSEIRRRLREKKDCSLASLRGEFDGALLRLAGFDAVPLWAIERA